MYNQSVIVVITCFLQVVGLGVDAYLKMLLVDNFVHTDLHPGNIFICQQSAAVRRCCIPQRIQRPRKHLLFRLLSNLHATAGI